MLFQAIKRFLEDLVRVANGHSCDIIVHNNPEMRIRYPKEKDVPSLRATCGFKEQRQIRGWRKGRVDVAGNELAYRRKMQRAQDE